VAVKNIGLFGHSSSGKTSFGEAMLFLMKENTRLGRTDEGTSIFDYDEDEIDRKTSINLALGYGSFKNDFFNIIDTPGYADFIGDVLSGVQACDIGVLIVDATSGVEFGTELVWKFLGEAHRNRVFFINKLKKEHSDFDRVLDDIQKSFAAKVFPVFLPIGKEDGFSGLVDVLKEKAYRYQDGVRTEAEMPADLKPKVAELKEKMIELACDYSESLMNKFMEGEPIPADEVTKALRDGFRKGEIVPILAGDAYHPIGVDLFLEFACEYLPANTEMTDVTVQDMKTKEEKNLTRDPKGPLAACVFKTISEAHLGDLLYVRVFSGGLEPGQMVYNIGAGREEKVNQIYRIKGKERTEVNKLATGEIGALVKLKVTKTSDTLVSTGANFILPPIPFPQPSISVAIVPKTKGDEERVSNGLARLHDEDPTFTYHYDPELKQQLVSGLGELHLDVIIGRLRRKFGVMVDLQKPKVPYRETMTRTAESQGKYKKQTGGHGQYGDVWLRVEPRERGAGFEFVDQIYGGSIPNKYLPSVEKGVVEAMGNGILAGYPVIDFRATVYDGSFHPVDSSDIAFKIATMMAFKSCSEKAGAVLLEPIAEVEVTVPETWMGDVIGDLNSRRGKILGMEMEGRLQTIKALVPQAEMYKYSTTLRSMTQGRGYFTMKFSHYEEVPKEISLRIIEDSKKQKA
jgi:elongation factor G